MPVPKILKKFSIDRKKDKAKKEQQNRSYSIKIQTFTVLNVLLFVGLALYSYQNYLQYSIHTQALAQNNQTITNLSTSVKAVRKSFQTERESFNEQKVSIKKDLDIIFPETESFTELTRQLDKYFFNRNSTNPPILHNNLRFEEPLSTNDFSILPFSMSIQTSKENFNDFLQYIETSGTIGSNIRLMSIQSIQINFIEPSDSNINEFDINFTVNMRAYFQNTNPQVTE